MITKPCETCAGVVIKKPSTSMRVWRDQVRFCSRDCYWVWRREHEAEIIARATARRVPPSNERHPGWKGEDAGYAAVHLWVNSHYPKTGRCDLCSVEHRRTHRAMRDPQVLTRDPAGWLELCPSCHKLYDNRGVVWLAA